MGKINLAAEWVNQLQWGSRSAGRAQTVKGKKVSGSSPFFSTTYLDMCWFVKKGKRLYRDVRFFFVLVLRLKLFQVHLLLLILILYQL